MWYLRRCVQLRGQHVPRLSNDFRQCEEEETQNTSPNREANVIYLILVHLMLTVAISAGQCHVFANERDQRAKSNAQHITQVSLEIQQV